MTYTDSRYSRHDIARVFPHLAEIDDVHEMQRSLAGHWSITTRNGDTINAHQISLIGRRRKHGFSIMGIAVTRSKDNERIACYVENLISAEKKVVDIDPDVLAARIAERRRNR